MTSIVFKHEGTLDKFIGDALMAVFGAPIAQKDHARRAVLAGLEMQEVIKSMSLKEDLGLDVQLRVRIGINSGAVVAGDIGSPQRMEYTVIGDTVNAASRIEEDVAAPGEVAIGEETWRPIQKDFTFEEIGSINLRGRQGATRCFRVICPNKPA
jgi:class 3 adenylate cyclase